MDNPVGSISDLFFVDFMFDVLIMLLSFELLTLKGSFFKISDIYFAFLRKFIEIIYFFDLI